MATRGVAKLGMATVVIVLMAMTIPLGAASAHNYEDALTKSILFFEGQRSGRLPPTQRMTWRKDSALRDGRDLGVDLVGGYYDAGDNVKFNFPMAWSTTMLAWSVLEFGKLMGPDRTHALDAVRWATDYFLKATSVPGVVFVQVGDPYEDHKCWERPEDMDTPRTTYAVSTRYPGSEVSAEIAAALAAASIVFKGFDPRYSAVLLERAQKVFDFAEQYQGNYNDYLGKWVCPFYCDTSGYVDELIWAATWLHRATRAPSYWMYVVGNINYLLGVGGPSGSLLNRPFVGGSYTEFGWDSKHAGINVLASKLAARADNRSNSIFSFYANKFVCSVLPESPAKSVTYSPGGLLFKPGGSNLQHSTAISFLLVVYARYLRRSHSVIVCDNGLQVAPTRLLQVAKGQVDYILGSNPMKMSYMVGYGDKFPQRIHHRGASLPCIAQHPQKIGCLDGSPYFWSSGPNPNVLTGAIVGGPNFQDYYSDNTRDDFVHSEPTTYINAPFVGVLAYFKEHPTP